MRYYEYLMNAIQAIIVIVLSSLGVYVFSQSLLYIFLYENLGQTLQGIVIDYPILSTFLDIFTSPFVLVIPVVILSILGINEMMRIQNKGYGYLLLLFFLFLSPIIAHSAYDWAKLYTDLSMSYPYLLRILGFPLLYSQNELGYFETVVSSFIFIIGYLILRNINAYKDEIQKFQLKGAKEIELQRIMIHGQIYSILIIVVSVFCTVLVSMISFDFRETIVQYLSYPMALLVIGIGTLATLSIGAYLFLIRHLLKTQIK
jgi:hypothetical protein